MITQADYQVVPAGTYYLCDPCYVIGSTWSELLESTEFFKSSKIQWEHPKTGERGYIVAFGTLYGDGVYEDQFGNEYPVDAGMIGLVDVRIADTELSHDLGRIVEFKEDTACACNCDGTLTFGEYKIPTGDVFAESYDLEDEESHV